MKHNQIIGPGENNYGRGWGYKGNNKCPKCGKPAPPNEVEVCGGMCKICSMISIRKRESKTVA